MQRNIIKRAQVQLAEVELQRPQNLTDTTPHRVTKKRAVLVEDDGKPMAIEVTCSCGEVTLIELELGLQAGENAGKSA
jgi:hypothetical protein